MKRPQLETLFSPVILNSAEIVNKTVNLYEVEYDGYVDDSYAKVSYDNHFDAYTFHDETLDLKNNQDLFARVKNDRNCMWCNEIDMTFAPSET